jgi:hypothetical protein
MFEKFGYIYIHIYIVIKNDTSFDGNLIIVIEILAGRSVSRVLRMTRGSFLQHCCLAGKRFTTIMIASAIQIYMLSQAVLQIMDCKHTAGSHIHTHTLIYIYIYIYIYISTTHKRSHTNFKYAYTGGCAKRATTSAPAFSRSRVYSH